MCVFHGLVPLRAANGHPNLIGNQVKPVWQEELQ